MSHDHQKTARVVLLAWTCTAPSLEDMGVDGGDEEQMREWLGGGASAFDFHLSWVMADMMDKWSCEQDDPKWLDKYVCRPRGLTSSSGITWNYETVCGEIG